MQDGNLLGKNQKRIVATALAVLGLTLIIAFLFGVFILLREFVDSFSNVLWPLAVAAILATMLKPVIHVCECKFRLSRQGSIVFIYGLALLFMGILLSFFVPILFSQTITFLEYLPDFIRKSNQLIAERYPDVASFMERTYGVGWIDQMKGIVNDNISQYLKTVLPAFNRVKDYVFEVAAFGTALAIVPVYLFYFLESNRNFAEDFKRQLSFINEGLREDIIFLGREFVGSIVSFFRGQIVIGFIMGALLAMGFSLAGLNFGVILGLTIGILNIIPYLGTILGLSFVLPIAYLQPDGGILLMGLSLLVFIIVQVIEGYLLTPKIMGKTTGLHPMAIIIAIFFWGTALNGLLGMILAIPLTAFFVVAWRLLLRKYLEPL